MMPTKAATELMTATYHLEDSFCVAHGFSPTGKYSSPMYGVPVT